MVSLDSMSKGKIAVRDSSPIVLIKYNYPKLCDELDQIFNDNNGGTIGMVHEIAREGLSGYGKVLHIMGL